MNQFHKPRAGLLAALIVSVIACISYGQVYWDREPQAPGSISQHIFALAPILDGNCLAAGDSSLVQLYEIDEKNDLLWNKFFGDPRAPGSPPTVNCIAADSNGYFIMSGSSRSYNSNLLMKITPAGDTVWTKQYAQADTFFNTSTFWSIIPVLGGGCIAAGTYRYNQGVYIIKFDSSGDTIWTKVYSSMLRAQSYSIVPAESGTYLVAGYADMDPRNIYVLKLDGNGDTIWTKKFPTASFSGPPTSVFPCSDMIAASSDGNYVIAGSSNDTLCVIKINRNGNALWTIKTNVSMNTPSGTNMVVCQSNDGNILVAGGSTIVKIKQDGTILWTKDYTSFPNLGGNGTGVGAIAKARAGSIYLLAQIGTFTTSGSGYFNHIFSIIDDKYAWKDSLFTFNIPVSGDSLKASYQVASAPFGMTISKGGTISWIPGMDSSYTQYVRFYVVNDQGRGDSLNFNIFVNSKDFTSGTINSSVNAACHLARNEIAIQTFPSHVLFHVPSQAYCVTVYNVRGTIVGKVPISNSTAVWPSAHVPGSYFAKVSGERGDVVKPFMIIR